MIERAALHKELARALLNESEAGGGGFADMADAVIVVLDRVGLTYRPEPENAEDRAATLPYGIWPVRYMTRDELAAIYPDPAEDRIAQKRAKAMSDKCGIPEDDE